MTKQKETLTDYRHIIYLQGYEAQEALDIYENKSLYDVIDYLMEWDLQPESCRHTDISPAGESDTVILVDEEYEICVNTRIGYIGLCIVS